MISLLPLETLPGWPEAPEVSTSLLLWLTVLGPLAVGVIIALLTFTPTLARRFRGEDAPGSAVARRTDAPSPERVA